MDGDSLTGWLSYRRRDHVSRRCNRVFHLASPVSEKSGRVSRGYGECEAQRRGCGRVELCEVSWLVNHIPAVLRTLSCGSWLLCECCGDVIRKYVYLTRR